MSTPSISIVTTVFNAVPYFDECARSVLAQTWGDFEWIVYDDGSTDGSRELVRQWAQRDSRVVVDLGEQNRGVRGAFEYAVSLVKAPWVAVLDCDDVAEPERLKLTLEAAAKNQAALALFGHAHFVDSKGDPATGWMIAQDADAIRSLAEFTMPVINSASAWQRGWLLERLPGVFVDATYDCALLNQVLEDGEIGWLPECLARYRVHQQNYSHRRKNKQWADGTALRFWASRHRANRHVSSSELVAWADVLGKSTLDEGGLESSAARQAWALGLYRLTTYHARRAVRRGDFTGLGVLARCLAAPEAWRRGIWPVLQGGMIGGAGVDRDGHSLRR